MNMNIQQSAPKSMPFLVLAILLLASLACVSSTRLTPVTTLTSPEATDIESTSTVLATPTATVPAAPPAIMLATLASAAPCRVAYVDKTDIAAADIFVQDCDGSNRRQVTKGRISTGHEPTWSPDGQRLVFDEQQGPESKTYVPTYLYIINVDGSNRTQIVAPDGPVEGNFPSWSPDGTRIAWQSGCEIMMINPDGSNKITVLAHRGLSGAGEPEMCVHRPMWSPDSQRLAFATFPLEAAWDTSIPAPYEYRFYIVNTDGSGLIKLNIFMLDVPPRGIPVETVWSPDGKQVAFEMTVDDKGTARRYLMNTDGRDEPMEVDSIPESWRPWHWPQWNKE